MRKTGRNCRLPRDAPMGWRATSKGCCAMQGGRFRFERKPAEASRVAPAYDVSNKEISYGLCRQRDRSGTVSIIVRATRRGIGKARYRSHDGYRKAELSVSRQPDRSRH